VKLPVNYADVRMEQLLQHIQTKYETAKDEELKRTIIVLLHSVTLAIQNWTKVPPFLKMSGESYGKKPTEKQSGGYLNPDDWS
jgi:extradiol dioxygenase family protein